ncbi:MAG: (2Fe-2S) ferredoxin domain-containing protein [Sphaerochaetaceae bacterium]
MNKIDVEFCMGSSCFARGNAKALEYIEAFLEVNKLTERVNLRGNLCLGTCSEGPNIRINGNLISNVNPEYAVSLLQQYLEAGKEESCG